jgi:hypothetical protein
LCACAGDEDTFDFSEDVQLLDGEDEDDMSDEMYSWVATMAEWIADHAKILHHHNGDNNHSNGSGGPFSNGRPSGLSPTMDGALFTPLNGTGTTGIGLMSGMISVLNRNNSGVNGSPIVNSAVYVPISREIAQDCAFGLIQFGIHSIFMLYESLAKFPLFLTEVMWVCVIRMWYHRTYSTVLVGIFQLM